MAGVEFEFRGRMAEQRPKGRGLKTVLGPSQSSTTEFPKVVVTVYCNPDATEGSVGFIDKTQTEPHWVDGQVVYLNPTFGLKFPPGKTVSLPGGMTLILRTD